MTLHRNALLLLIAVWTLLLLGCDAQYSYGQATYYNSIDHGCVRA
jgi:hypothetical protein